MTTKSLDEMSIRELRSYAEQIEIKGTRNMGRTQLRREIAAVTGADNIEWEDEDSDDQMVVVDAGDLSEACDAANAWAGHLRSLVNLDPSTKHFEEAADRIDAAVNRLRRDSYDALLREDENDG